MYEITQRISNHPILTDVERYVNVTLQQTNFLSNSFEFWYNIDYKQGDILITDLISQPKTKSLVIDNSIKIFIKDEDGERIENPDWDGISINPYDKYLWQYGWDYIVDTIHNPTIISDKIKQYILINDSQNYFDDY